MEQHAVPRQVTTFEFKLIGFLSVKQFVYLMIFSGLTAIAYYLIAIPYINFVSASLVAAAGALLTFYRYNDRPLDMWIKNLFISLMEPSQYNYHKNNEPPDYLKGIFISDATTAQTHVDAHNKLSKYLAQTGQTPETNTEKEMITQLIHTGVKAGKIHEAPSEHFTQLEPTIPTEASKEAEADLLGTLPGAPQTTTSTTQAQTTHKQDGVTTQSKPVAHAYLSGLVKNSKGEPLPQIMVYINTPSGELVRILKTNPHGVFATFHPLANGQYNIVPKDLGGTYFFDTMNINVNGDALSPIDIYSKELI